MPASGAATGEAGPDPHRAGDRSGGAGVRGAYPKRCKVIVTVICILFVNCCLIVVPLATTLFMTSGPLEIPAVSMSDTRIVSYPWPSSLCGGITLVDNSRRPRSRLYLVKTPPPLTRWNNFTFSRSLTLVGNAYQYWNYYLRPNSNFTAEICTRPNSNSGIFYLIKGRNNFQKWVNAPSSSDEALAFFSITSFPCSARIKHQYSFQVQAEDEYYFVYYSKRTSDLDSKFLLLNVTISIGRLQYSTFSFALGSPASSQCSTSSFPVGSCTVPLTYADGSNYKALIVAGTSLFNKDWTQISDLSLHCTNRAWTFVVAVLVPYILVNVILCCTIGAVVAFLQAKENRCCDFTPRVPPVQQQAPGIELGFRHNIRLFPETPDHNPVTLNGKQDLTAVAPPTYGDSLAYPSLANDLPSKFCEEFPPSYECATNNKV